MVKLSLSLILLISYSSFAQALDELFELHLWNNFIKSYDKQYFSDEHETFRFNIFKENLNYIEKHNEEFSQNFHSYTLGVNVFADWSFEEFQTKMLGVSLDSFSNQRSSKGTFTRLPKNVKIPDKMDWRKKGAVTPVKNQGACGSCWAFSTTGSLEGAHFRVSHKLVSLSEQQLVDCSTIDGNNGCSGGLMDNAFKYIEEVGGLDTEDSYPYKAIDDKCHFKNNSIGSKCSGFIDIVSGDEKALMEAVATMGPISVAIDATRNFMFYKEGIFEDETCENGRFNLDHGVLLIGYGSDNKTEDFWIVKNSWGTTWGEKGYIRMGRNLNNMCGIATYASYPLVKAD